MDLLEITKELKIKEKARDALNDMIIALDKGMKDFPQEELGIKHPNYRDAIQNTRGYLERIKQGYETSIALDKARIEKNYKEQ
jgi:hypothetical protein